MLAVARTIGVAVITIFKSSHACAFGLLQPKRRKTKQKDRSFAVINSNEVGRAIGALAEIGADYSAHRNRAVSELLKEFRARSEERRVGKESRSRGRRARRSEGGGEGR